MHEHKPHAHSMTGKVFRLAVLVAFVVTMMPAGLAAAPSTAAMSDIHGTVTDLQDGLGITGVSVTAYHMAWAPWEGGGPRISQTVETDGSGEYSIPEPFDPGDIIVRPGSEDFWVEAFANGYYDGRVDFEWDGEGSKQVDIELEHAGDTKVTGEVLDIDTEDPIEGIVLEVHWVDSENGRHQTRVSDVDGEFELQGIPSGTDFSVQVWGMSAGYEDYFQVFTYEGPEVLEIQVWLRKADPRFWVDPVNNWVQGDYWMGSSEVTITIGDLGDPDFETSVSIGDWGGFGYWVDPDHWDIEPGDTVTVWNDETTKVHVVTDLAVTDVDFAADIVSGEASPLAELTVWITTHYAVIDPFDWIPVDLDADMNGAWTADFSDEFDITMWTGGEVFEWDEDRDATRIAWGFDPENPGPMLPIAGADRFATAIEASRLAYPHGAETVVIATGMNWPDALGGTALAGAVDGPILLTMPDALPAAVLDEIDRLWANNAIILGGEAAVSAAVEAALEEKLGEENVERIWGPNRYATADAVALEVIELLDTEYDGTAFVATGGNFPDALAAAPLAAAQKWPLFLANPATGLSAATVAAMADVEDALILGGEAVVSASVETQLDSELSGDVTRLWGADRFATAVAVAEYAVDEAGHGWNRVGIATGMDFPDALAGGVLQGRAGSVMLLTTPTALNTHTQTALSGNADEIDTITFFGGANAVSNAVRTAALTAAGAMP